MIFNKLLIDLGLFHTTTFKLIPPDKNYDCFYFWQVKMPSATNIRARMKSIALTGK
jgi:hypothetical protein